MWGNGRPPGWFFPHVQWFPSCLPSQPSCTTGELGSLAAVSSQHQDFLNFFFLCFCIEVCFLQAFNSSEYELPEL